MVLCTNTPLAKKLEDKMIKVWSLKDQKVSRRKRPKSKANIMILKEINGKAK